MKKNQSTSTTRTNLTRTIKIVDKHNHDNMLNSTPEQIKSPTLVLMKLLQDSKF